MKTAIVLRIIKNNSCIGNFRINMSTITRSINMKKNITILKICLVNCDDLFRARSSLSSMFNCINLFDILN